MKFNFESHKILLSNFKERFLRQLHLEKAEFPGKKIFFLVEVKITTLVFRERNSQIENENVKLLKKMVRINETGGRVDNRNQNQFSRSLNSWKRKQELDRIERENISILKRIGSGVFLL